MGRFLLRQGDGPVERGTRRSGAREATGHPSRRPGVSLVRGRVGPQFPTTTDRFVIDKLLQKNVLDKILGPDKAIVIVDVVLGLETNAWDALTENAKQKDLSTVKLIPTLLARAGFQIYRIKTQV